MSKRAISAETATCVPARYEVRVRGMTRDLYEKLRAAGVEIRCLGPSVSGEFTATVDPSEPDPMAEALAEMAEANVFVAQGPIVRRGLAYRRSSTAVDFDSIDLGALTLIGRRRP